MTDSEAKEINLQLGLITNAQKLEENHIRPWIRFWARIIDNIIFMLMMSIIIALICPSALYHSALLFLFLLFIWTFIEAILLSTWGTTPGKWLLKIMIRDLNGSKLTLLNSLKRSLMVWAIGLAAGIGIFPFFTVLYQYNYISRNGRTSWDNSGKFIVSYTKIGLLRILVSILIIFGFIGLMILGRK